MITENGNFDRYETELVFEAFQSEGYSTEQAISLMNRIGLTPFTSSERVLIKHTANFHIDNGDTEVLAFVKAMIKIAQKRKLANTLTFKH